MALSMNDAILLAIEQGYRISPNGEVIGKKGKVLAPITDTRGYRYFNVREKGQRKTLKVLIHRLQAHSIFGEAIFEEGVHVRHLDGDARNNAQSNLALGSSHDNIMDRTATDRQVHAVKAATVLRKLTDDQVRAAREARAKGARVIDLAEEYGVVKGTMSMLLRGIMYGHVR